MFSYLLVVVTVVYEEEPDDGVHVYDDDSQEGGRKQLLDIVSNGLHDVSEYLEPVGDVEKMEAVSDFRQGDTQH